jgi:hypothetical protein
MQMTMDDTLNGFKWLTKQCKDGKSPKAFKLLEVAVYIYLSYPKIRKYRDKSAKDSISGSSGLESVYYSIAVHVRALSKSGKLVKVGPGKYRVSTN